MSPLTVRSRISLSMAIATAMVLPVVVLSVFYFKSILSSARIMASVDARIVRIAENVSIGMFTVRRAEKNYLITGDSSYVAQVDSGISSMRFMIGELVSDPSIPEGDREDLLKVRELLREYSLSFDTLLTRFSDGHIYSGRMRSRISGYITDLDRMVRAARESGTDAERDSMLSEIEARFRSFELLTPELDNPEVAMFTSKLRDLGDKIYGITQRLAERNWRRMESHREEITRISLRAQRNIISIVILTVVIVAYMIAKLPGVIIRPIDKITGIIRQAESGDLSAYAEAGSKDEIGELATFLNKMLKSLRTFDALKTRELSVARAKLKMVISNSEDGVLIIDPDRAVEGISRGAMAMLGIDLRSVGKKVDEVLGEGDFRDFLDEALDGTGEIAERSITFKGPDGEVRRLRASAHPIRDNKGNFAGVVAMFREVQ